MEQKLEFWKIVHWATSHKRDKFFHRFSIMFMILLMGRVHLMLFKSIFLPFVIVSIPFDGMFSLCSLDFILRMLGRQCQEDEVGF